MFLDALITSLDELSSPDDFGKKGKRPANTMSNNHEQFRVAVLDDYQNVALAMADWPAGASIAWEAYPLGG